MKNSDVAKAIVVLGMAAPMMSDVFYYHTEPLTVSEREPQEIEPEREKTLADYAALDKAEAKRERKRRKRLIELEKRQQGRK